MSQPTRITVTAGDVLKQGDTLPELAALLYDHLGVAVNLTGSDVTFAMVREDGRRAPVQDLATVVSASTGSVKYSWTAADTAEPGRYRGEFKVRVISSGAISSYPSDGYIPITILPKAGTAEAA